MDDLVDRLPDVAALMLGRWKSRLARSQVDFLETHLDRHDWMHQDIADVRAMLPPFARGLLDPLPTADDDNVGC
jgi:hypothetical protein